MSLWSNVQRLREKLWRWRSFSLKIRTTISVNSLNFSEKMLNHRLVKLDKLKKILSYIYTLSIDKANTHKDMVYKRLIKIVDTLRTIFDK